MNGKDLRTLREGLGLSREAFAKKTGLSEHSIAYWENENKPIKAKYEMGLTKMRSEVEKDKVTVAAVTLTHTNSLLEGFKLLTQTLELTDKLGVNEKQYLIQRLLDQLQSTEHGTLN